jgi:hypothetical protein
LALKERELEFLKKVHDQLERLQYFKNATETPENDGKWEALQQEMKLLRPELDILKQMYEEYFATDTPNP